VNTRVPGTLGILHWWRDEGGRTITFGGDAHRTEHLARGFPEAATFARSAGYAPGREPHDPWETSRAVPDRARRSLPPRQLEERP